MKSPIPLTVIFLSEPVIFPVGRGDWYELYNDWFVQVYSAEGELTTFMVPKGFRTDLASVPRLPGMYMLFGNKARRASIMHDRMYELGMEREFADSTFYAGMKDEVNSASRWAMWLAVRIGGESYYAKRTGPSNVNPETNREAP